MKDPELDADESGKKSILMIQSLEHRRLSNDEKEPLTMSLSKTRA